MSNGATGARKDVAGAHDFLVEIDGQRIGNFNQCSGLTIETDILEYQEGGENSVVHKFIGQTRQSNIVLERGFTTSKELWNWYRQIWEGSGRITRKNGSIVLLGQDSKQSVRWNFSRGWPCRWVGPALSSDGSSTAIEVLEIAHEGLKLG